MLIAYLIIFLAYWCLFTMGYNVACDLLQQGSNMRYELCEHCNHNEAVESVYGMPVCESCYVELSADYATWAESLERDLDSTDNTLEELDFDTEVTND